MTTLQVGGAAGPADPMAGSDSAQDTPSGEARVAADKASGLAVQARDKAGALGGQAAAGASAAMTATGQQMQDVAQKVRERAPAGMAGHLTRGAAGALERGGDYLRRSDVNTVPKDVREVVRHNPRRALAVGVGVGLLGVGLGFLLVRLLRR